VVWVKADASPTRPYPMQGLKGVGRRAGWRAYPYVMRTYVYWLALSVGLATHLSAAALKAGAAVTDITPKEFPMNMPGGFSANPATSAHDPLSARALVMDDGKTKFAWVVIDNLGVPKKVVAEAKELASKATGIPVENMLVSGTHTHSGVNPADEAAAPGAKLSEREAKADAYRKVMLEGVSQAIIRAHAKLQPASVGIAARPLPGEVFNRRWFLKPGKMPLNPFGEMDKVKMNPSNSPDVLDKPAGPTDPDISVVSVIDAKRKPLALFANYSLHYVGAIPAGQVSADYYGEFARLMPARLGAGEGFVAAMSNGTSGDINNTPFATSRPPREPFEQVRIVASEAADTAWRAVRDIEKHRNDVVLGMRQRLVTLKYRKPTDEQLMNAKAILAMKDKEAIERLPRLAQHYAAGTVAAANRPEETIDVIVQAIKVGDAVICSVPFETFAETGLELKKKSPFARTLVVGLGNGRHGYLPTPAQHELGGYETWLGTNVVQKDASEIIVRNLVEMMGELK
jgi:neutral ceramidase